MRSTTRLAAPALGLAVLVLAGCGSSGSSAAAANHTADPASFCSAIRADANLGGNQSDNAAHQQNWDQMAASAPDSLAAGVQEVDRNYRTWTSYPSKLSSSEQQRLEAAVSAVKSYAETNCNIDLSNG